MVFEAEADRHSSTAGASTLTPRGREVAILVAQGLTNAEIGQRLMLAPGTVANHVEHIRRALGMTNRVQLAVWTVKQGLY